jgi:hypothetical protein
MLYNLSRVTLKPPFGGRCLACCYVTRTADPMTAYCHKHKVLLQRFNGVALKDRLCYANDNEYFLDRINALSGV